MGRKREKEGGGKENKHGSNEQLQWNTKLEKLLRHRLFSNSEREGEREGGGGERGKRESEKERKKEKERLSSVMEPCSFWFLESLAIVSSQSLMGVLKDHGNEKD